MRARIVEDGGNYTVESYMGIGWAKEGGMNGVRKFASREEAMAYCDRNGLNLMETHPTTPVAKAL